MTDHSRSRGVYQRYVLGAAESAGSSPLARGLPIRATLFGLERRIIPARAGFTPPGSTSPTACPDHPRSRGVYPSTARAGAPMRGSSPLARGLPADEQFHEADGRIIPARAGFTYGGLQIRQRRPDHPRSRGVYPPGTPRTTPRRGSSPLARGLRHSRPAEQLDRVGSSPLARGLPGILRPQPDGRRIIPARAGFTVLVTDPPYGVEDHPRSRGVYDGMSRKDLITLGSSPLARGLPARSKWGLPFVRIIPARAGFTTAPRRCRATAPDHPRSRGVYGQRSSALLSV